MKPSFGTYALVLRTDTLISAQIGRWGSLNIQAGYYIYVGSAFGPGGLLARVSRHCREAKSKHWHIDYLREFAIPTTVWYSYANERLEHDWAKSLAKMKHTAPVKGFGCSDCKCESHLFFTAEKPDLTMFAKAVDGQVESWLCETSD